MEPSRIAALPKGIYCPVSNEPFKDAHMVNCTGKHSFSLASIIEKFGDLNRNLCEIPGPCPICRERVTECWSNPDLQKLVDEILAVKKEEPYLENWATKYPLEESQFELGGDRSILSDGFVAISLQDADQNQNRPNRIQTVQFIIRQSQYIIRIYFDERDVDSSSKLLKYMKHKNIHTFKKLYSHGVSHWLELSGSNCKEEFRSTLQLLRVANKFNDGAQQMLKELLGKVESQ